MPKRWIVYLITCTVTDLQYVGQTRQSMAIRWGQHIQEARNYKKDWPFAAALRDYDESQFTIEVLAEYATQVEAIAREISEIDRRGTRAPQGYNLTKGGHGRAGMEMPKEWRAKHSRLLKAKAATGVRWGTNSSAGQRDIWRSYTPEQKAARLARSDAARRSGPEARRERRLIREAKQAASFRPGMGPVNASESGGLSNYEIRLRFYGGCSACKLPRWPGNSGRMCVHAASLTQADIARAFDASR